MSNQSLLIRIKKENPGIVSSVNMDPPPRGNKPILTVCLKNSLNANAVADSIIYLHDRYKATMQIIYKNMHVRRRSGHLMDIKYYNYKGKCHVDDKYLLYYIAENMG
jgi:hypothetical protein